MGVLVTHAHPDHVAGIATLIEGEDVPVVALPSVVKLMEETEQAKHAQWSQMFGDEWIPKWAYPNRLVEDGEVVTFDGVDFQVYDLGPGGDCDANSMWIVEDGGVSVFIGDLVFNGTHCYIADGRVLKWLANIERIRAMLPSDATLYPGHGPSDSVELLEAQRDYLLAYCAALAGVTADGGAIDDDVRAKLTDTMRRQRPGAPLEFMIGLSADAVAAELGRSA